MNYTRSFCRRLLVATAALATLTPTSNVAAGNRRAAMLHAARASLSASELREHAGVLADDAFEGREAGTRGGHAAARYLIEQMQAVGLQPGAGDGTFVQHFHGTMRNLIGKMPGSDPDLADEVILLGAHYDHVGYGTPQTSYGPWGYIHNGADDNASGVAALLELMEALRSVDYRPKRTIVFAFWDGEEKDLLGSRHWVRNPTVSLAAVRLAINIDMIGRMIDGRLIVGGTRTGFGLRKLLSDRELPADLRLDFTWEYKENSDHWPLFQSNVPSLYIHTGFHDDYHRPSDDVERLNIDGIRQTTEFLVGATMRVADADELPAFRPAGRLDSPDLQRRQEAPLPPSIKPARLGLAWRADASEPRAVFVTRVNPGSPAARAGLQLYDRIYSFAGEGIADEHQLLDAVRTQLDEGVEHLALTIERRGRIRDIVVDVGPGEPDPSL